MTITENTPNHIREFDELCARYNLSKDSQVEGWDYLTLQMIWIEKKQGEFFTPEEIMADFSAMESAQFLLQLETNKRGVLEVTTHKVEGYESQHFIQQSKLMYQDYLNKRVQKCARLKFLENGVEVEMPAMILSKGYGGGFTGRAYIIPYPNGVVPQQEGWSNEELQALIEYEKTQKGEWLRSQGICKKHSNQKSRRLELKMLINELLPLVPIQRIASERYAFVFDYLKELNFLVDIDACRNKFSTNSDKHRYIRDLLK